MSYEFQRDQGTIQKEVTYFLTIPASDQHPEFGPRPERTRELNWIDESQVKDIPLVNESLRPLLGKAFQMARQDKQDI